MTTIDFVPHLVDITKLEIIHTPNILSLNFLSANTSVQLLLIKKKLWLVHVRVKNILLCYTFSSYDRDNSVEHCSAEAWNINGI